MSCERRISRCAAVTADPVRVAAEYFRAWKDHDLSAISLLFSSNAKYKILPKRRVLQGLSSICNYWKRNQKRQKDFSVSWNVISSSKNYVQVKFGAEFYDNEEDQRQSVTGKIEFFLDNSNMVVILSEDYRKGTAITR